MFVAFRPRRSVAFACCSSDFGTVWGTMPLLAGKKNADDEPLIAASTARCHNSARPEIRSAAAMAWLVPLIRFEATITWCRGRRSAQTPPKRMNRTVGTWRAVSTMPSFVVDWVRSSTANESATGAIALPAIEIVRPAKSRRNSRSRSGPSRLTLRARLPVARQALPRLPERRDPVVRLRLLARVRERCVDERLLAEPVAHTRRPAVELGLEPVEVRRHVLVDPEMDQREALRSSRADCIGRLVPRLDIDVRRRRHRQHVSRAGHPDAGRVTCEQRAVAEVTDVVRRMSAG